MTTRIHRTYVPCTPAWRARKLAEKFYRKVQAKGARQVRLYRGVLRTYPYPARRGYGTRGLLVGIYTLATRLEWIEEDVLRALSDTQSCDCSA